MVGGVRRVVCFPLHHLTPCSPAIWRLFMVWCWRQICSGFSVSLNLTLVVVWLVLRRHIIGFVVWHGRLVVGSVVSPFLPASVFRFVCFDAGGYVFCLFVLCSYVSVFLCSTTAVLDVGYCW
ncbi:hypothetical protein A2U01_0026670 [Trifolium medium]|uniref:Transmembrane protein n=1 Tax=Trifolium medium TaxID=97028 RepID=A0A392P0U7_9FABA|nr:hypothetical protein [Trifolium medium]